MNKYLLYSKQIFSGNDWGGIGQKFYVSISVLLSHFLITRAIYYIIMMCLKITIGLNKQAKLDFERFHDEFYYTKGKLSTLFTKYPRKQKNLLLDMTGVEYKFSLKFEIL